MITSGGAAEDWGFGCGNELYNYGDEQANKPDAHSYHPLLRIQRDCTSELPQDLHQQNLEENGKCEDENEDPVVERVPEDVQFFHLSCIDLVENLKQQICRIQEIQNLCNHNAVYSCKALPSTKLQTETMWNSNTIPGKRQKR
jgi:hypothetical protein